MSVANRARSVTEPTEGERDGERALVGAIVLGADLAEIRTFLRPEDFYDLGLAAAYGSALELQAAGIGIDNVSLARALEELPASAGEGTMLDRVGGRAGLQILVRECPTTRNAQHYAEIVAAGAARRAGRSTPALVAASPTIERIGLGFRASFVAGVELKVDHIRESHGEVSGELSVRWSRSALPGQNGHIYRGRFNLSSLTARGSAGRFLETRTRGAGVPWLELLEQFCVGVLDEFRAGEAFEVVGRRPPRPGPSRLVHPIMPMDAATLLYGSGGTGKSTLAAGIAVSVATGREVIPGWRALSAPVLYLDWESSADVLNDRVAAIAAGLDVDPPEIHYRRMDGAMADRTEELAAFMMERGIGLAIIDSVGMSGGSSRDGSDANESALRLFGSLRAMGVTSLLIDHVAGAELATNGAISKAYGSVYKMNLARAAYELRREREGTQERTELVLRQAKPEENAPRLKPITIAIAYEPGRIRFELTQATAPDLLPLASTITDRIAALLAGGALKAPAIADELDLDGRAVRTALSRGKDQRFVRLKNGSWGLVAHA